MNRTERLNDMIRYLNGKHFFELKDLMEKYGITKGTASKDVHELAVMGMPIFKELGQGGKFLIINDKIFQPVQLSMNEIYLLTFLLNIVRPLQPPTLQAQTQELVEKITQGITPLQQTSIAQIKQLTTANILPTLDNSLFLNMLLQYLTNLMIATIIYQNNSQEEIYTVQFYQISYEKQRWYVTAYNFETEKLEVFQCDKIMKTYFVYNPAYQRKSLVELGALEKPAQPIKPAEALELLAAENIHRSKSSLYRWIREGKIKRAHSSDHSSYLIDKISLLQHIQKMEQKSQK